MGLKKDFASGVLYTSLAKYSGLVIQIVITSVLARLLTPADFGVVAIATVLIQFFNTISEAGIGPAIIQRKELTRKEINAIFTFTIILGIILSVLFYFGSEPIAAYYDDKSLISICRWLSTLILFSSADIVTNSLLLKQKKFKAIAVRTIVIQLATGVISIYLAITGWGMYALVLSAVSSKLLIFIVNYCLNPLGIDFGFRCLAKIRSYSFYQFCFNLVNYFSRNLDKLIIGKYIGMNQLGYYEKSYRLMMLPLGNITNVLTPVMHPVFSELQKEKELMLKHYLRLLEITGIISFPVMAFLFFNAEEIVLLFFGDQWEASILPFKILSLTAAFQVLHATSGGIFQAIDDTKGLFIASIITAAMMIAGFIISACCFRTIEAVAVSFLVTCTAGSILVFHILFRRFGHNVALLFTTLKQPLLLGALEFILLWLLSSVLPQMNIILSLTIKSAAIAAIAIAFLYNSKSNNLKKIIKTIRR